MAMLSDYCRRIQELLLRYCDSLRVDSGGNLHDEAIAAENVFKEILNATYGWNLTNANAADPLTAGYDLIDDEEHILVQVSKDDSSEKIRHSFSALDASSFQGYTFKFMMLVPRHRRYSKPFDPPQGIHFDGQEDVLDISSLMNYLRNLPLETVREVHELVEQHMMRAVDVRSIPTCLGKVVRALIPDMRDLLSSDKFARAPVPRRLGDARMSPSRGVPRLGHVHPRTRACESDIRALASAFRLSGWGLPPV